MKQTETPIESTQKILVILTKASSYRKMSRATFANVRKGTEVSYLRSDYTVSTFVAGARRVGRTRGLHPGEPVITRAANGDEFTFNSKYAVLLECADAV